MTNNRHARALTRASINASRNALFSMDCRVIEREHALSPGNDLTGTIDWMLNA
jgi:hypothetical protein